MQHFSTAIICVSERDLCELRKKRWKKKSEHMTECIVWKRWTGSKRCIYRAFILFKAIWIMLMMTCYCAYFWTRTSFIYWMLCMVAHTHTHVHSQIAFYSLLFLFLSSIQSHVECVFSVSMYVIAIISSIAISDENNAVNHAKCRCECVSGHFFSLWKCQCNSEQLESFLPTCSFEKWFQGHLSLHFGYALEHFSATFNLNFSIDHWAAKQSIGYCHRYSRTGI